MDLTIIYRRVCPNTKEYSYFSAAYRISSKTDHIFKNKVTINNYRKFEIIFIFYLTRVE